MNDKLEIKKNHLPIRKERILNTAPITSSSLDLISKKIILAHFNNPLVEDLPEKVIRVIVMKAVNRAIADTSCSGLDAEYMHEHVANDIIENFSHFTVEEIELAFHLGARKKLGEYYGLSVVAFFQFLENYKPVFKRNAFSEWRKYSEEIQKQEARDKEILDNARIKAENQKFVKDSIAILQNYIDGKIKEHKVKDVGNMIFNSLVNLKIIILSEKEKADYYDKALKRHESKNKSGTLGGALAFLTVEPISKKLALHDFIEKCRKDKVNLLTLFNKAISGIEKK